MIEFRQVRKVYPGGVEALSDVSFLIEDGEFVFCIGESGAGKSTLIRLLTCEDRPTTGTITIDNYEVNRLERRLIPYLRRKIGIVYQDFRLIDTKTVFENVAFAMEIVGADRKTIRQRVSMILSLVGLRKRAENYPPELSGGEAQRVGIARAIINNPRLILADEPTGNLDPANSEAIMALLEEINRAGTTIIACTHDVNLVNRMKKRVIALDAGILVRDENQAGYADQSAAKRRLHDHDDLNRFNNMSNDDRTFDDLTVQREADEHLRSSAARSFDGDRETAETEPGAFAAVRNRLTAAGDKTDRRKLQDCPRRRRKETLSLAERIARLQADDSPSEGALNIDKDLHKLAGDIRNHPLTEHESKSKSQKKGRDHEDE